MENIFEHFKGEETFVKKMLEEKKRVLDTGMAYLSPFLDPRKQAILSSLIGKDPDFILSFDGLIEGAEAKRALLSPYYLLPEPSQFQMVLVKVIYPKKYVSLSHRDILGALMHAGIKRDIIGDIFVDEDIYFVCDAKMFDYLSMTLTQVGRTKISLVLSDRQIKKVQEYRVETFFIPSFRLDVIVSSFYRLSRKKAADAIRAGFVKVNHKVVVESHFLCNNKDTISVRGFGRVQIVDTFRKTKQHNEVVEGYFYK